MSDKREEMWEQKEKTVAAKWALENNLCPVPDVLKTALYDDIR